MVWFAFIIYIIITLFIGWYAQRSNDDGKDFWTAGRSLGGFSVGLSISAGFMSVSWSCVYAVQLFYWYGIGAIWLITIPWVIALTGIYYLSKKYHSLDSFSQPEMIAKRFDKKTKKTVATALTFVFLVWAGAEIYVAGTLLAPGLNISKEWVILIISLVVGVYGTMGGFRAVVMTDKLQFFIVAIYIFLIAVLAYIGLKSEPTTTSTILKDISIIEVVKGAKSGTPWYNFISPGWTIIVLTLIAYLPGWIFETDLWLRVQAAKDEKAAKKGVIIAGINSTLFVGVFPAFIGISALFIFPMEGINFPEIIGYEGDAIFSALVLKFAPEWLQVAFSVGLVAAAMSTIDTCINVMALSIGYDLGEIQKRKNPELKSKLITISSVIMAFLFALNTESLWDIFYLSSGILTTAVAFPVAAVFIKKANTEGVFWSSISGFAGTIIFYFLESKSLLSEIEPHWLQQSQMGYILWGIVFAVIGYFVGKDIGKEAGRQRGKEKTMRD